MSTLTTITPSNRLAASERAVVGSLIDPAVTWERVSAEALAIRRLLDGAPESFTDLRHGKIAAAIREALTAGQPVGDAVASMPDYDAALMLDIDRDSLPLAAAEHEAAPLVEAAWKRQQEREEVAARAERVGLCTVEAEPMPRSGLEAELRAEAVDAAGNVADNEALARLAALPPMAYDRCRKAEAERLGVLVATLDTEVARRRAKANGDATLQGHALLLPDPEPWPQPVDGAEVFAAVSERFLRYVALPPGAADALTLWVAHTHAFEAFGVSPRLNLTSPEKGCGKTTTADLVAVFVPRPLASENMTTAVLFRVVAARKPVILADEYDSWLRDSEELRGLLNAGHKRGGQATRCEGDNHEVRAFPVFAPAVLAGIGALPVTLADRSIIIRLTRAKPGEIAHRFDSRRVQHETDLCRKLARWAADHKSELQGCDPTLPDTAHNRTADNWRVLMAIAEVAGGDWPRRAAEAYQLLTAGRAADDPGLGTRLLIDIRDVFEAADMDRLASVDLCDRLVAFPEAPWAEYARGRPLTPARLARLVAAYGVSSRNIRLPDGSTPKGYVRHDLADAWARYLPDSRPSNRHNATTRASIGESAQIQNATDLSCGVLQNAVPPNNHGPCGAVAFPKAGSEEIDTIATL